MDDEPILNSNPELTPRQGGNRWLIAAAIVLLCTTIISLAFVAREAGNSRDVAARNDQLNASLNQTRAQMDMLAAKLNAVHAASMAEETPAPAASSKAPQATHLSAPARHASEAFPQATATHAKHPATRHARLKRPAEDPRWKQVQAQLAQHQKELDETQANLQKTRDELQGNLNSARDDLNGSIAKTHDELVALEKKGERNYYEFDLSRSKQFQHIGSLSIQLRKADAKHQHYDAVVLLDDYRLNEKHVNLYQPVVFYPEGGHEAIQLVVNKIGKNHVSGYVSEPKYRGSETAASSASEGTGPSASGSSAPAQPAQPASGTQASLQRRQE